MSEIAISEIEYFVIAGYLVLTIIVGLAFKNFSTNTDDYFKGGSKGTWWLVGTSAFMGSFTAWTFTGAAGMAYEAGYSVMFLFLGSSLGYFMNFLFLAPWLRQLRVTTLPEAISLRFGERTRNFYALYEVPVRILYASMGLYSLGIFCSAVFGYDINYVIILCGVVVLIYSATGGRWAVMATDFLQGLILVPLTLIVAWICLDKLGGIDNLLASVKAAGLSEEYKMVNATEMFAGAYTWGWISAIMVKQFLVYNSLNAAPRYFSAKDGRQASKAALLASVLLLAGSLIWSLPPITARLLFHDTVMAIDISKPSEASYAIASIRLLPAGLVGMIVVAILTATMSSMDTGLNTNVAILIKDIYPKLSKRLRWQPKNENQLLHIGRLYTWFLGTMIILLALYFAQQEGKGIFEIMLDVGALLAVPIAIPLLWGLFFRRTPSWAGLLSIGCAFVVSCLAFFDVPLSHLGFPESISQGFSWNYQQKLFSIFCAGSLGFFVSMFFAPAKDDEHRKKVDNFFRLMKTPIDFEKEIGQGNDLRQLTAIGGFGVAITCFIALLLLIPNPPDGRLAILSLVVVIGSISFWMLKLGKQRKP